MHSPSRMELQGHGLVSIDNDNILGTGSYGKVCKAKCGQLPCAAKFLHDTMFEYGDPGTYSFTMKFQDECRFLTSIKHPNIVQCLGTISDPESRRPILLMELMDESLTKFLERSVGPLPFYNQVNICHDIALALAYLHFNHVIHRDLSSNNVLLIGGGSRAKVTDFGMSKFVDINPRMTPLTQCPGTVVYMPPEAIKASPHYNEKLDCFSFGVLVIQILTKNYPKPGEADVYVEDPRYPNGRVLVQFPEVERRKEDLDLIEHDHPLRPVAIQCIQDRDMNRPSASELCKELATKKGEERYLDSVAQSTRDQTLVIQRLQQDLLTMEAQVNTHVTEVAEWKDRHYDQYLEKLKWKEMVDVEHQRHEGREKELQNEIVELYDALEKNAKEHKEELDAKTRQIEQLHADNWKLLNTKAEISENGVSNVDTTTSLLQNEPAKSDTETSNHGESIRNPSSEIQALVNGMEKELKIEDEVSYIIL